MGLHTTNLPFYCSGGPPAPITFKPAADPQRGTFTTTGVQIISSGPLKGHKGAALTATGRFQSGGR